jgi:hypothetical protein
LRQHLDDAALVVVLHVQLNTSALGDLLDIKLPALEMPRAG